MTRRRMKTTSEELFLVINAHSVDVVVVAVVVVAVVVVAIVVVVIVVAVIVIVGVAALKRSDECYPTSNSK